MRGFEGVRSWAYDWYRSTGLNAPRGAESALGFYGAHARAYLMCSTCAARADYAEMVMYEGCSTSERLNRDRYPPLIHHVRTESKQCSLTPPNSQSLLVIVLNRRTDGHNGTLSDGTIYRAQSTPR